MSGSAVLCSGPAVVGKYSIRLNLRHYAIVSEEVDYAVLHCVMGGLEVVPLHYCIKDTVPHFSTFIFPILCPPYLGR